MKRITNLKSVIIIAICFCFLQTSYGQLTLPFDILAGGVDDAQKIFTEYVSPAANGIGASLSTGWYNTAKPHKLGGFDLTFSMNLSMIPDEAKTYDLSALTLSDNARITGDPIVSTMSGKNAGGTNIDYYATVAGNEITYAGYEVPPGIGLSFIPIPTANLSIGLIKETEIMGRWIPTVSYKDKGEVGLWGLGLKHSISQWIPAISKIPFLNISAMGGYTKFHAISNIDITPEDVLGSLGTGQDLTNNSISWDNQSIELGVSSFTMNLLVSADIPIVTFYGGLGFASTKTNLDMFGYYPLPTVDDELTSATFSQVVVTNESVGEKDPLSMEIKNSDGGTTKARLNIGMRLKFGVITLHGDFTKADYSVVTAGLGINFR